jgi:hypothetical protein
VCNVISRLLLKCHPLSYFGPSLLAEYLSQATACLIFIGCVEFLVSVKAQLTLLPVILPSLLWRILIQKHFSFKSTYSVGTFML